MRSIMNQVLHITYYVCDMLSTIQLYYYRHKGVSSTSNHNKKFYNENATHCEIQNT